MATLPSSPIVRFLFYLSAGPVEELSRSPMTVEVSALPALVAAHLLWVDCLPLQRPRVDPSAQDQPARLVPAMRHLAQHRPHGRGGEVKEHSGFAALALPETRAFLMLHRQYQFRNSVPNARFDMTS